MQLAMANGKWATGKAKSAKENGKLLHILYFMLEIFMISCNLWLTFGPQSVRLGRLSCSLSAPLTVPLAGKRLSLLRSLSLSLSGRWSYLVWPARAERRPVKRRVCQSVKYAANALIAMAIEFMWQTSLTPSPSWFWFRSWYLVNGYSALASGFSGCSSSCSLPMVSHRCSNLKQLLRPKLDMCPALSLIVFPLQHLNFALGQ